MSPVSQMGFAKFAPSPTFVLPHHLCALTLQRQLREHFEQLADGNEVIAATFASTLDHDLDQMLESQELPAVAIFRQGQLEKLAALIDGIGHGNLASSSSASEDEAASSDSGTHLHDDYPHCLVRKKRTFLDDKTAWDVLNKMIFFAKSEQCSAALFSDDDVIPSNFFDVVGEDEDDDGSYPAYVKRLLNHHYTCEVKGLQPKEQERAVKELDRAFTEAALAISKKREHKEQWKVRLQNGKRLTDATIGVGVCECKNDQDSVQLIYHMHRGQSEQAAAYRLELYRKTYERLCSDYKAHNRDTHTHNDLLLTRLFVMALPIRLLSPHQVGLSGGIAIGPHGLAEGSPPHLARILRFTAQPHLFELLFPLSRDGCLLRLRRQLLFVHSGGSWLLRVQPAV